MKKKWISVIAGCIIALSIQAQKNGYHYHTAITKATQAGFYNIALLPELTAHIKTDYSDVRIVDSKDKWVPHVLNAAPASLARHSAIFQVPYTVTENNKLNTVILVNAVDTISSNIVLAIMNTAAQRYCTISGSNDKNNWFVINDSILLNPVAEVNSTVNSMTINFPPNSYHYFKVAVYNNNKDPFDIRGVGNYQFPENNITKASEIQENPGTRLSKIDSGKMSIIRIDQLQSFHFDHIDIQLHGSKYFNRRAGLFVPDDLTHSFSHPGRLVQELYISNNSTLHFPLPLQNARSFYICIYNEDNQPMIVTKVTTSLTKRYLKTYLEKDENYELIIGNKDATTPVYDLPATDSSLLKASPFLATGSVFEIAATADSKKNTGTDNQWILWIVIAAVLATLGFFTFKMMKEVDKKKTV